MVTRVIRVYTKTPAELWSLAIRHGVPPLDFAKYLALGVGSNDPADVRIWSMAALSHDKFFGKMSPDIARRNAVDIATTIKLLVSITLVEYGDEDTCALCVEGILHHISLMYLYAVARIYGLKPIVQEGEYKSFKYLIVVVSETGLPEATKALETMIEEACERERICR